jgi:predicted ATP-grasp superfamily ATP-dependent carboligase
LGRRVEIQPKDAVGVSVQTPILILALGGLSMHHGALGIARSAGGLGIPVFLAHDRPRSPVDSSRYCCGSLTIAREATTECKLEILRGFGHDCGRAVLVAVDDASAMFVGDHAGLLEDVFLFPRQPDGLARALADKREILKLCGRHEVCTPVCEFPQSEVEVVEYAHQAVFPVVVKRIDASLPAAPDAPNARIADNPAELLDAYRSMEAPDDMNVMLQEYIPAVQGANWMFNGYFDAQGRCTAAFTGRKLRQSPPDAGATTLGLCEPNRALEEIAKRFMEAVGYRGIVDIDYRLDNRDGQYKLLDVNPRIGASFRLFAAVDGMDVLRAMYLDLASEADVSAIQAGGRRWMVEPQDLRSSMTYFRRGDLTIRAWVRSLCRVEEAAWWSSRDPLPFVVMSWRLLVTGLRKRLGPPTRVPTRTGGGCAPKEPGAIGERRTRR